MEETSHPTLTFQDLPPEIITNCLKFLDFDDLLDCRLVSHQFNYLILSSHEIMRKLRFVIEAYDGSKRCNTDTIDLEQKFMNKNMEELSGVLEAIGHHIRKIEFRSLSINFLMELVPNLEELTINENLTYYRAITNAEEDLFGFTPSKRLMIFNNLKELTIEISQGPDFEILTDFVAQQPNLKHLSIKFAESLCKVDFPTSDIASKVTFQLKNFEFHTAGKQNESPHFNKFFEGQAEFIDSLSIDFNPDEDLGEIIIKNCVNLKTFSLLTAPDDDYPVFTGFRAYWTLPSVTTLISKVMINHKFSSIAARFPNLSKLKCESMCIGKGKFESITEIEVDNFISEKMQNCRFPNLERLEIKMLNGPNVDHWDHFFWKLTNLESLIISDTNIDRSDFKYLSYGFKIRNELGNMSYWKFMNKEFARFA